MSRLLLDSCILIDYLRGYPAAVAYLEGLDRRIGHLPSAKLRELDEDLRLVLALRDPLICHQSENCRATVAIGSMRRSPALSRPTKP